jgi:hypothetical protein
MSDFEDKKADASILTTQQDGVDECKENATSTKAERAQRYQEFEKNLTVIETIKTYKRIVLCIMYAQLICFGYGIDQVIAASLLGTPNFQMDFGRPYPLESSSQLRRAGLKTTEGNETCTSKMKSRLEGWASSPYHRLERNISKLTKHSYLLRLSQVR